MTRKVDPNSPPSCPIHDCEYVDRWEKEYGKSVWYCPQCEEESQARIRKAYGEHVDSLRESVRRLRALVIGAYPLLHDVTADKMDTAEFVERSEAWVKNYLAYKDSLR